MTRRAKNILFIMYDQLRWDYLGCAGHPYLKTPNMDRLAMRGVRFSRAYVQSPICGSSRMSTYTGRYVRSHGSTGNNVPLKVGEMTMGDHLRARGMSCHLVGKTHMVADADGMARLGLAPDSVIGARLSECGFDVFERDDGLAGRGPDGSYDENSARAYNDYLRAKGYESENPWHDFANAAVDATGDILSGWFYKNARKAANIAEDDSETPYMTRRGIAFMTEAGDAPWCCHLSYIKPHWPYIVPAPYNDMYGPNQVQAPERSDDERVNAHPVLDALMNNPLGRAFSRDDVRAEVIPAYMGLVRQCDDQLGVLLDWMEKSGRIKDTMIILTSDHGDYLGDHWMGDKMFFHDASVKVPLIIFDPSAAAESTRGAVVDELVESLDLAATFTDVVGGDVPDHILEGRSLLPFLHGKAVGTWRDCVISEFDFSTSSMAEKLGLGVREAVMFMVADKEWKLIHFEAGLRPILFDLGADPGELVDLGGSAAHAEVIARMYDKLFSWARRSRQNTTVTAAQLLEMRTSADRRGIVMGIFDESEIDAELTAAYRGKAGRRPTA